MIRKNILWYARAVCCLRRWLRGRRLSRHLLRLRDRLVRLHHCGNVLVHVRQGAPKIPWTVLMLFILGAGDIPQRMIESALPAFFFCFAAPVFVDEAAHFILIDIVQHLLQDRPQISGRCIHHICRAPSRCWICACWGFVYEGAPASMTTVLAPLADFPFVYMGIVTTIFSVLTACGCVDE